MSVRLELIDQNRKKLLFDVCPPTLFLSRVRSHFVRELPIQEPTVKAITQEGLP